MTDLAEVGGKNASLGEMLGSLADAGIRVPEGFATTARAYEEFLAADGLGERIAARLRTLDPDDVSSLEKCGREIRGWIEKAPLPEPLESEIRAFYQELTKQYSGEVSF